MSDYDREKRQAEEAAREQAQSAYRDKNDQGAGTIRVKCQT